jgi:hypothetical protein
MSPANPATHARTRVERFDIFELMRGVDTHCAHQRYSLPTLALSRLRTKNFKNAHVELSTVFETICHCHCDRVVTTPEDPMETPDAPAVPVREYTLFVLTVAPPVPAAGGRYVSHAAVQERALMGRWCGQGTTPDAAQADACRLACAALLRALTDDVVRGDAPPDLAVRIVVRGEVTA